MSEQAKCIMCNFKPGRVILDQFSLRKIAQHILLVFPFRAFDNQFPYSQAFSGIRMSFSKVVESFQVYD